MASIKEIQDAFESIAPFSTQEGYDNSGLLVGKPSGEVNKILITIDTTEAVVMEALENKCQLIVAHHPIIFKGIKRFNSENYVQRTVELAIKNDISILAVHTNLDNSSEGVNKIIAEKLGLQKTQILRAQKEDANIGAGLLGEFEAPIKSDELLKKVKDTFKTQLVRHTGKVEAPIKKIAVCGGAGSFLLEDAKNAGAQAYLSGDFKYHEFFDADSKIMILDPGHFESERFTVQLFERIISEKFPNIALQFSEVVTNPIHYFF